MRNRECVRLVRTIGIVQRRFLYERTCGDGSGDYAMNIPIIRTAAQPFIF